MPSRLFPIHRLLALALALSLTGAAAQWAGAQSQEPKPTPAATPAGRPDDPEADLPQTGVTGSRWEGPNHGISVEWDPALWTVAGEDVVPGYDGLQIGTPASTVFIEAYEGFSGDAGACLEEAEREIRERDIISEVTALSGRPLPDVSGERGPAELFGIVATFPDGSSVRGIEYVECRTLAPGSVVLELTWQTTTAQFNNELPAVGTLFTAITQPGDMPDPAFPELPSPPALPEPNTARSTIAP